jgi:hypothetical protein
MTEAAFTPPPEAASSSGREVVRSLRSGRDPGTPRGHWASPDIAGDILAIARRAGAAAPVEIRVRPEVQQDLRGTAEAPPADLDGIPLVVDEDLPAFPGYEVHRDYGSRAV